MIRYAVVQKDPLGYSIVDNDYHNAKIRLVTSSYTYESLIEALALWGYKLYTPEGVTLFQYNHCDVYYREI